MEVHEALRLPAQAQAAARLWVRGDAEAGDGARLGDLYVQGSARVGAEVRLRGLAAGGDLVLGAGCTVDDCLDSDATVWVGPRSALGRSASSGKGLHLGAGCTFQRLWGLPVSTDAPAPSAGPAAPPGEGPAMTIEDVVLWAGKRLTLPGGLRLSRDVVAHGAVRVGPGAVILGSIKAHGAIHLAEGVEVEGSLIGRRDVRIIGRARIAGNVFAEGDVIVGPGTRIGREDGFKTVYAAGRVELGLDVLVFGWVVTGRGGSVASA